ncbi:TetR/AcrR family transcriptional regulator [Sphingobacterium sp. FBM7-1]|uniref:TetR/AcrR family transcriptional regulator n=1 Tax=Sphingobacterium sp. FBM7-1 TaxID=2886688 RepID=UPI001D1131BB|nr:TetR/AcrR family transcriptional regulator [Sphingobacterium sp. FBM7-1]MCC2600245.1 TetR/AcrR family transcriptional regulator [Sphingobacterium sp. FBM7-1]
MSKNVDVKRAKILDVAKRRFAHFGMTKTTMAEIAKDLSFSKALLYYYFPDKHSLYTAVLEHVVNEMINKVEAYIPSASGVEEILLYAVESRMSIMRDNYNLFEYSSSQFIQNPGEMGKNIGPYFERIRDQYSRILKKGVDNKEIKVDDFNETAELLLFSLMGMRVGILSKDLNDCLFPTPDEFDLILTKQQKMVKIFLRGLRHS